MKQDIVDIYLECGNFREAVKKSGLPVHIAHLKLLKSGALKIQDKINYGSKAARLGGKAEELFQKLVPGAVDANKYFQKNNPVYDFMFGNLTIDVKYSSFYHRDNHAPHWQTRVQGNQDFIVVFLEKEPGNELQDAIILLLPMQFIPQDQINLHISQNSMWIKEFSISAEDLQEALQGYSDLREAGMF